MVGTATSMGDEQEPKVVWLLQRFQQVQEIGWNWDIQSRDAFIGHQNWVGGQCMAGSAKQRASLSTPVVHTLKVERLGEVVAGTL